MILYHRTTIGDTEVIHDDVEIKVNNILLTPVTPFKLLVYIFWIYRERLCLVRSEAIPERRHNSGVGSGQNSFYSVARWEKARMAGGRSSNTANRANYHRITGESKLESEKTSENYMVSRLQHVQQVQIQPTQLTQPIITRKLNQKVKGKQEIICCTTFIPCSPWRCAGSSAAPC